MELFRVIYRAAKLEPLANRPIVFDVRTFIDRERVGGEKAVVVLRDWWGLHRKLSLEHVAHRVGQAVSPGKDGAVLCRFIRILHCARRRTPRTRVDKRASSRANWSWGMDIALLSRRRCRADRAGTFLGEYRGRLATMNVRLHERRVGLGRHHRRRI